MTKRGPKTAAGRRAVRLNAVRHGVSSESPVIPGLESEAEWQEFRPTWVKSLEPVGFIEEQFAELEVMQARRGVRPGPLPARVQFHGFPGA